MKTEIIRINDTDSSEEELLHAANVLVKGGLVVFPTETVYGLGGDGTNPCSAKKIYHAKGRPSDNPLIIHIANPEEAEKFAVTSKLYYSLAKAFMPGPITVIMKKKDIIPYEVTGGLDTVAVRCPSHPIAHKLIEMSKIPIAAPSANISGRPSPTSADHVINDLNGKVDIILDGGECDIGLESTIVMVNNDNALTLLRPGAVTFDALQCVCEEVNISPSIEGVLNENEHPLSPGMKYKHYAPAAPLVLLDGDESTVLEFMIEERKYKRCVCLCYDEETVRLGSELIIPIGRSDDIQAHARNLFAALRNADTMSPDVIYAHLPSRAGLGLALYNRMIRAAAHTVKKIDNNHNQIH